eukprot:5768297-Alexandrium_andersonii.AAC.1
MCIRDSHLGAPRPPDVSLRLRLPSGLEAGSRRGSNRARSNARSRGASRRRSPAAALLGGAAA